MDDIAQENTENPKDSSSPAETSLFKAAYSAVPEITVSDTADPKSRLEAELGLAPGFLKSNNINDQSADSSSKTLSLNPGQSELKTATQSGAAIYNSTDIYNRSDAPGTRSDASTYSGQGQAVRFPDTRIPQWQARFPNGQNYIAPSGAAQGARAEWNNRSYTPPSVNLQLSESRQLNVSVAGLETSNNYYNRELVQSGQQIADIKPSQADWQNIAKDLNTRKISEFDSSLTDKVSSARAVSCVLEKIYKLEIKADNESNLEDTIKKQGYGWFVSRELDLQADGSVRVQGSNPQAGDIIIAKAKSDQPGHSAIYLGNNQLLHQDNNSGLMRTDNLEWLNTLDLEQILFYHKQELKPAQNQQFFPDQQRGNIQVNAGQDRRLYDSRYQQWDNKFPNNGQNRRVQPGPPPGTLRQFWNDRSNHPPGSSITLPGGLQLDLPKLK